MAGTYLGKCLLFGLSICSKSWRGNVGEKNGGVGMNCKGGDRENSGGKQWEAKRAVKSLYPSAWWKPENLVKFTSYARIKRKHWISEYDTTENRGLLPTTSFDNARTICFKSVILRIMYYSYKCYSRRFKSFRIYNILYYNRSITAGHRFDVSLQLMADISWKYHLKNIVIQSENWLRYKIHQDKSKYENSIFGENISREKSNSRNNSIASFFYHLTINFCNYKGYRRSEIQDKTRS